MRKVKAVVLGIPPNLPYNFTSAMNSAFSNSTYPISTAYNWEAIAKMETAAFTSKLYKSYNNPWGMRDGSGRQNHQSGKVQTSNGVFGTYSDLENAAKDIVDWMDAAGFSKATLTLDQHVEEMNRFGYFGSQPVSSYLALVKEWINK